MKLLLTILFLFPLFTFAQQDSALTSLGYYDLISSNKADLKDTSVVKEIHNLAVSSAYSQPKKHELYAFAVFQLSSKINYKTGISTGYRDIADAKMVLGDYDSAVYYADKSLAISNKENLYLEQKEAYRTKGNIYYYTGEYSKSLDMYFKTAELCEKYFKEELSGAYGSIGMVFRVIGNQIKALEYLEEGLQLAKVYKDTSDQMFILNNLGIIAKNQDDYEKAKEYYDEGLKLSIETNNIRREGEFVYNSAHVYFKIGDTATAMKYLERSSEITEFFGFQRDLAIEHQNLGLLYMNLKQFKKSEMHSLKAIDNALACGFWEAEMEARRVLAEVYFKTGRYKWAYEELLLSGKISDSIDLKSLNSEAYEIENEFREQQQALADSLQKEKEALIQAHEDQLSEEKVRSRERLLIAAGIALIGVVIGLVFLFRSNKKVKAKNQIITLQKDEIEEQHKEITDSINYAQRIQSALISGNEEWDKISEDHFILFMPKDVVSGDFYWAYHSNEEDISIWVTADCTGHGVPGAFMSMLGIGFLNEIIVEGGQRDGGEILNSLRKKIIKALEQKGAQTQQKDGMDLALCILDRKANKLSFTGANNGLYIIRDHSKFTPEELLNLMVDQSSGKAIIEYRPNKMPVGFHAEQEKPFISTDIQLQKDDLVLCYTDGYADQFGGDKGKKLKYKPFKSIILANASKPVKLQGEILRKHFEDWKGDYEQIDDVCVIGVKV
ncbi:tetratricopeptide repeat protein [Paracrocinitomix mangrovi]|uniref:SpoIIE family protein phosphatase n=1 Tax=Paracrocinitomix mangrovi TaxID=2862509 RepID=UPI001C8D100B|nr:SpoIIE family protein phosphatase [Paracrocinitomix mangrovi]UKN03114.1 tetratricopeptide repeat protein [Paracrocinitomix mangrovi]